MANTSNGGAYVPGVGYNRTGATDSKGTYANATLTTPTITSPTISGTTVIGSGATLTSPTINTPTITTPTISNPTITGPTPISVTGSSVTLGATHVGRVAVLNRGAGVAVTLPAATGTGSTFTLFVGTASNASTVATAPTTDVFAGGILINDTGDTTPATADFYPTASNSNKMSMTTAGGGGLVGDLITLVDVAAGVWSVQGVFTGATDPVTPFSHV